VGWFTAQGEAVATGLVPAFFTGSDEAVSSSGMFETNGVAALVRLANKPDDSARSVSIGVRAHGDFAVGMRLHEATLAWDRTGRPGLAGLRVRAIAIEHPYQARAGETVLTRSCSRLILDWPS
jgi:hypothetical protein